MLQSADNFSDVAIRRQFSATEYFIFFFSHHNLLPQMAGVRCGVDDDEENTLGFNVSFIQECVSNTAPSTITAMLKALRQHVAKNATGVGKATACVFYNRSCPIPILLNALKQHDIEAFYLLDSCQNTIDAAVVVVHDWNNLKWLQRISKNAEHQKLHVIIMSDFVAAKVVIPELIALRESFFQMYTLLREKYVEQLVAAFNIESEAHNNVSVLEALLLFGETDKVFSLSKLCFKHDQQANYIISIATALQIEDQCENAIRLLERELDLNQLQPQLRGCLCKLYCLTGSLELAVRILTEQNTIDRETTLYCLGCIYNSLGKFSAAQQTLDCALEAVTPHTLLHIEILRMLNIVHANTNNTTRLATSENAYVQGRYNAALSNQNMFINGHPFIANCVQALKTEMVQLNGDDIYPDTRSTILACRDLPLMLNSLNNSISNSQQRLPPPDSSLVAVLPIHNNVFWERMQQHYFPLRCQFTSGGVIRDLFTFVNTFLFGKEEDNWSQQPPCVLLLVGEAGTGKTTFVRMLEQQLLCGTTLKPVRIDLSQFTAETAKTSVANTVKLEDNTLPHLFIFDGYETLRVGNNSEPINLWTANQLEIWPKGTKAIITCRPDCLNNHQDIDKLFTPVLSNPRLLVKQQICLPDWMRPNSHVSIIDNCDTLQHTLITATDTKSPNTVVCGYQSVNPNIRIQMMFDSGHSVSTIPHLLCFNMADMCRDETIYKHRSRVSSVASSPNGLQVVSGSSDRTAVICCAVSGQVKHELLGHTASVSSVAWSPDGARIASGSWDCTVRLWQAMNGVAGQEFRGHENVVWTVAWSHDSLKIASGSADKTVRLWDVAAGVAVRVLKGHTDWVCSVAWSPKSSSQIVSGSWDKTVRLWDSESEAVRELNGHTLSVNSVAWSPDAKQIVSGSSDKTVRLWDPVSGAAGRVLHGHADKVNCVAWSPDGLQVSSSSADLSVRLWQAAEADGDGQKFVLHTSSDVNSVSWSPSRSCQLFVGLSDGDVRAWKPHHSRPTIQKTIGYLQERVNTVPIGARIILVGTHMDLVENSAQHQEINQQLLRELKTRDGALINDETRCFFLFDNNNNNNNNNNGRHHDSAVKLRQAILDIKSDVKVPVRWLVCLELLKEASAKSAVLSLASVKNIASTMELDLDSADSKMLSVLHENGLLCCCPDSDLILLHPHLFVQRFMNVIKTELKATALHSDHALLRDCGILSNQLLREAAPDIAGLMQLACMSQLAVPLPERNEKSEPIYYFIPSLLSTTSFRDDRQRPNSDAATFYLAIGPIGLQFTAGTVPADKLKTMCHLPVELYAYLLLRLYRKNAAAEEPLSGKQLHDVALVSEVGALKIAAASSLQIGNLRQLMQDWLDEYRRHATKPQEQQQRQCTVLFPSADSQLDFVVPDAAWGFADSSKPAWDLLALDQVVQSVNQRSLVFCLGPDYKADQQQIANMAYMLQSKLVSRVYAVNDSALLQGQGQPLRAVTVQLKRPDRSGKFLPVKLLNLSSGKNDSHQLAKTDPAVYVFAGWPTNTSGKDVTNECRDCIVQNMAVNSSLIWCGEKPPADFRPSKTCHLLKSSLASLMEEIGMPTFNDVGISLAGLQAFWESLKAKSKEAAESLTTRQIRQVLVSQADSGFFDKFSGPATVHVSHAWDSMFEDLLSSLVKHNEGENLPNRKKNFYWIDIFCQSRRLCTFPTKSWTAKLDDHLTRVGKMLLIISPWNEPKTLKRARCVWELHRALNKLAGKVELEITTSQSQVRVLRADISMQMYAIPTALLSVGVKIHDVHGSNESDVRAEIEASLVNLNSGIKSRLRWLYVSLAEEIGKDKVGGEEGAKLMNNLAACMDEMGEYHRAAEFYENALTRMLALTGGKPPEEMKLNNLKNLAASHNNLAVAHENVGRHQKAEDNYLEALKYKQRILERARWDHRMDLKSPDAVRAINSAETSLSFTYNNVAAAKFGAFKYHESLQLYILAEEKKKRCMERKQDPSIASTIRNMASVYRNLGRLADSERSANEALTMNNEFYGNPSNFGNDSSKVTLFQPDIARSRDSVGETYMYMGRFDDALKEYQLALTIRLTVHGQNHPDIATSKNNIGEAYLNLAQFGGGSQSDTNTADPNKDPYALFKEAMRINISRFGEQHVNTAKTICNLALASAVKTPQSLDEAVMLAEKALKIREESFKKFEEERQYCHPDVALSATVLGELCILQGNLLDADNASSLFDKAQKLLERARLSHAQVFVIADGDGQHKFFNAGTGRIFANLAKMHLLKGELAKALECSIEATENLMATMRMTPYEHPLVTQSREDLRKIVARVSPDSAEKQQTVERLLDPAKYDAHKQQSRQHEPQVGLVPPPDQQPEVTLVDVDVDRQQSTKEFDSIRAFLEKDQLKVERVQRVENKRLRQQYDQKRQEMAEVLQSRNNWQLELDIKPKGLKLEIDPAVDDRVYPESVGEFRLLHATMAGQAQVIAARGFDARVARSGFYGSGTYFAEDVLKAAQYLDRSPKGRKVILVCRVLLGHSCVTKAARWDIKRPPCIHRCKEDLICGHQIFDSVLADPRTEAAQDPLRQFREFIVYDNARAFPEYIVDVSYPDDWTPPGVPRHVWFKTGVEGLAHRIKTSTNNVVFFLGSGCSYRSGIPTVPQLMNEWATSISDQHKDAMSCSFIDVMKKRFNSVAEADAFLRQKFHSAAPTNGHLALARLAASKEHGKRFNVVMTTNFDRLIETAFDLYDVPCTLVSNRSFESRNRPQRSSNDVTTLVKLYGDCYDNLSLKTRETWEHVSEFDVQPLSLAGYAPKLPTTTYVFIGWSGNGDAKLTSMIEQLDGPIFWCNSDPKDTDVFKVLQKKAQFVWVDERDFDRILVIVARTLTGGDSFTASEVLQKKAAKRHSALSDAERKFIPLRASRIDVLTTVISATAAPAAAAAAPAANVPSPVSSDLDLLDEVKKFLDTPAAVLLLKGEAGSGKTFFSKLLEMWLTKLKEDRKILSTPIYVDLSRYNIETVRACVEKELGGKGNVEQLQKMKEPFLFIFDGFDLLMTAESSNSTDFVNLWESNFLSLWPHGTKAIITCRSEFLALVDGFAYQTMCKPLEMYELSILPFAQQLKSAFAAATADGPLANVRKAFYNLPERLQGFVRSHRDLAMCLDAIKDKGVKHDGTEWGKVLAVVKSLEKQWSSLCLSSGSSLALEVKRYMTALAFKVWNKYPSMRHATLSETKEVMIQQRSQLWLRLQHCPVHVDAAASSVHRHHQVVFRFLPLLPEIDIAYHICDILVNPKLSEAGLHILDRFGKANGSSNIGEDMFDHRLVLHVLKDAISNKEDRSRAIISDTLGLITTRCKNQQSREAATVGRVAAWLNNTKNNHLSIETIWPSTSEIEFTQTSQPENVDNNEDLDSETIELDRFIVGLRNRPVVFFLGPGCSEGAGIPSMHAFFQEWKEHNGCSDDATDVPFKSFFGTNKDEEDMYFENRYANKQPTAGHCAAAALSRQSSHYRIFLSMNMDRLLETAFGLASQPIAILEPTSTESRLIQQTHLPVEIKICGSLYKDKYWEGDRIPTDIVARLNARLQTLQNPAVVFIGWAGHEKNILQWLGLLQLPTDHSMFWCNTDSYRSQTFLDWLRTKNDFHIVTERDFDNIMTALKKQCNC
jgi:WD40 repeat protein/tetratricopeptide (TPR) repeat protein/NAD-dependent SIR2 family protein deacetylase/tRNA A37 threonylcarbamoyladenosine biosynthesis protein TsaE